MPTGVCCLEDVLSIIFGQRLPRIIWVVTDPLPDFLINRIMVPINHDRQRLKNKLIIFPFDVFSR